MPALSGLSVLVTRPAAQAATLCRSIEDAGGEALAFPAVEIEPLQAPPAEGCDLAIFVSINAVAHGAHLLPRPSTARIAAIGKATAAALTAAELTPHVVPESGFNSEALLSHPELNVAAGARVLIVRGVGGREVLQQAFTARGMSVQTREVYRRVKPQISTASLEALEGRCPDQGIDVVTLTSVETLDNLLQILGPRGRELLRSATLLVASERIANAAAAADCRGEAIIAGGADDASMLGAMARWRTRARTPRARQG